jgi:dienelactone hydrolase
VCYDLQMPHSLRILALLLPLLAAVPARAAEPETVYFMSADGKTEIVGYLFKPSGPAPHPAMVMLHGRAGPYSANDNADCTYVGRNVRSRCNASTLSKRHMMWGEYWADHGYLAVLPDSFGPRGVAHGFPRDSHNDPDREAVNERTVRPLDAEGALAWFRRRDDVDADHIFLQGWSNGGSTVLNTMIRQGSNGGFRGALAFYPGCGEDARLEDTVRTTAPMALFQGADDEEVAPVNCRHVVGRSLAADTRFNDVTFYPGATHDFDDPGEARQKVKANRDAKADAMTRAITIVQGMSGTP